MFHRQGCGLTPLSVPVMVRVLRVNPKFQPMRQIPWGQVPQSAVGSLPIVVSSPGFHLLGSVLRGQEPVLVQALLTEASVERLNEGVVRGLPGPAEVQLHPVQAGPLVQPLRIRKTMLSSIRLGPTRLRPVGFGGSVSRITASICSQRWSGISPIVPNASPFPIIHHHIHHHHIVLNPP